MISKASVQPPRGVRILVLSRSQVTATAKKKKTGWAPPWGPMGPHGAPMGPPWGPMGPPWRPWGPHGPPMGPHGPLQILRKDSTLSDSDRVEWYLRLVFAEFDCSLDVWCSIHLLFEAVPATIDKLLQPLRKVVA